MKDSIEGSFYPTVAELLELPAFRGHTVVAGKEGLDLRVSGINLSDTPDYYLWLSKNEILVTACHAIHNDTQALDVFVSNIARSGMSAVFIKPFPYLKEIPDIMVEQADTLSIPLISVPKDVQFSSLIKAISDELLRRQTIRLEEALSANKMLTSTIIEGAVLEDIVCMISSLLNNSVMILDTINVRQAFHICLEDQEFFSGFSAEDITDFFMKNALMYIHKDSRTEDSSDYELHPLMYELKNGDASFGYLYLYSSVFPVDPEPRVLYQIQHIVPLEITREQQKQSFRKDDLTNYIYHLLSDQILDEKAELSRAAELGIRAEEAHIIVRIQVTSLESANSYTADIQHSLLFNNMRSFFSGYGFSVHTIKDTGGYIILLSSTCENKNLADLKTLCSLFSGKIVNHYNTLNIAAGCGRPHTGINGLAQSDREARIALRAARNCKHLFTCFDDLNVLRLVCADNPHHEIDIFVQETLGRLIEYDRTKNSELLRTLESYFRNMGNLRQVSKEMYTHYNTITYRLKNITELTNLNINDYEDRFRLMLALSLYKDLGDRKNDTY